MSASVDDVVDFFQAVGWDTAGLLLARCGSELENIEHESSSDCSSK